MTSSAGLSSLSSMFSFNPSQASGQLISSGDQNGDSALSFSEFSALDNATSSQATGASGNSERMSSLFDAIDTDSDGSLTESELTEFGQKLSDAMSTFMLQMQEQAQFGDSSEGGAGSSGGSGGSSQSDSYDPLDTNKDGVVSFTERLTGSQSTDEGSEQQTQSGSDGGMDLRKCMLAASSYQTTDAASISSSILSLLK